MQLPFFVKPENSRAAVVCRRGNNPLRSCLSLTNAEFACAIANEVVADYERLIPLYHGDNEGLHEYWQSAGKGYILFRNYQEQCWNAAEYDGKNGTPFLFSAMTLEELVDRIGTVRLQRDIVWNKNGTLSPAK